VQEERSPETDHVIMMTLRREAGLKAMTELQCVLAKALDAKDDFSIVVAYAREGWVSAGRRGGRVEDACRVEDDDVIKVIIIIIIITIVVIIIITIIVAIMVEKSSCNPGHPFGNQRG
jgi:hypothetical protein